MIDSSIVYHHMYMYIFYKTKTNLNASVMVSTRPWFDLAKTYTF